MVEQSGAGGRIDLEIKDRVAVLTMDRGENRMNLESMTQFLDALDRAERDPSVRALVTTATGKFYSNGIDLKWVSQADEESGSKFLEALTEVWMRVLTFPAPTVAAINGHAFAGGAILALAHDYRLMRKDRGWLSVNEVHLGLPLQGVSREIVKAKTPRESLSDVAILGRRFTGPEAVKAGIVNAVYSEAELLPAAIKLTKDCQPSTGISRDSLRSMKENFYENVVKAKNDVGMTARQTAVNRLGKAARL